MALNPPFATRHPQSQCLPARTAFYRARRVATPLAAVLLAACGQGATKVSLRAPGDLNKNQSSSLASTSSSDGSATSDPVAGKTVTVGAGADAQGSSATVADGSVPAGTDVQAGDGAQVANDIAGSYLTMPPGIEPAGPPLYIAPSTGFLVPTQPLMVSLAITLPAPAPTAAALALVDANDLPANFAVIYKTQDANNVVSLGIIARPHLKHQGKTVVFAAKEFGIYQATLLPEANARDQEVVIESPVLRKEEAAALPTLVWPSLPTRQTVAATATLTFTVQLPSNAPKLNACTLRLRCGDTGSVLKALKDVQIGATMLSRDVLLEGLSPKHSCANDNYEGQFICDQGRQSNPSAWSLGDAVMPASTPIVGAPAFPATADTAATEDHTSGSSASDEHGRTAPEGDNTRTGANGKKTRTGTKSDTHKNGDETPESNSDKPD